MNPPASSVTPLNRTVIFRSLVSTTALVNSNYTRAGSRINIVHLDPSAMSPDLTLGTYLVAREVLTNATLNRRAFAVWGPGTAAGDAVLEPVSVALGRPLHDMHIEGAQLSSPQYHPYFRRYMIFLESPTRAYAQLLRSLGVRQLVRPSVK